ncbi:hypothetical protein A1Q1_01286 [Trichosporon asahii var. asahii CBS 2479]|uniref:Hexosyltransferase n=1 Tax=Trichosporon asahii var. asahii (strain ATCC 90039 / CBS 2479 / JCM 2466 / KCTC 7840 / NBRC 103889/ NCYC 2677 / UAMH 7654) TaxID=1186058 RepID=J5T7G2_TRIAS|nr:hypothetical protein A1Q1_01286 [Trichosporon asahii var. asahii CBS 2479]EJT49571.1 hypothetical protein A1Q1_01286 [Trichosporon asahii var. asahii CBS 2479]
MTLSAYDLFTFKARPRLPVVLASAVLAALIIFVAQLSLPDRPPGLQTATTYAAALDEEGVGTSHEKQWLLEPEGVQRSFEEPDYSLLSARQPHEIGCDIPLEGANSGKLAFIGIFSSSLNGKGRRDLYRKHILPEWPDEVEIKFILAHPPAVKYPLDSLKRLKILDGLKQEAEEHKDMVILDIDDNIDFGKTFEYFKWVAQHYAGDGQVRGRPRFVMKADDDTYLVMPNVVRTLQSLNCKKNVYWGTSAGSSGHFRQYFRGLGYGLSWPLVSWIGSADLPYAHKIKIEDARTGQWLRLLDPVLDPVQRIDYGWAMGDWNQLNYTTETVALPSDRDYTPEFGSDVLDIIDFGKVMPPNAKSPKYNKLSAMGQKDLEEASKVEKAPLPGVITDLPDERAGPLDEPTPQPASSS